MTKSEQARLWAWRIRVLRERRRALGTSPGRVGISGSRVRPITGGNDDIDAQGEAGLWDRTSRPNHSPRATPREVIGKILYLPMRSPGSLLWTALEARSFPGVPDPMRPARAGVIPPVHYLPRTHIHYDDAPDAGRALVVGGEDEMAVRRHHRQIAR